MDKLTDQLRKDAADIHAEVSPELDHRIRASLAGIEPEQPRAASRRQSPVFWWASSLTGISAAVLVIVVLNMGAPESPQPVAGSQPPVALPELPTLPLKAEAAMITSPLEAELEAFQSDLEKARDAVNEDVRQIF